MRIQKTSSGNFWFLGYDFLVKYFHQGMGNEDKDFE